ncbi:MAG: LptE family protein [Saprospiraceae bacterium]|nr:LptE family protein [Saprospiraceae bacterium]
MERFTLYFFVGFMLLFGGCYSFRGIAIETDVKTYYVNPFLDQTIGQVPSLAADFTEKLNVKIRNESPLVQTNTDPHVEFSGSITRYEVTAEAPKPGEDVAFNRLTISVRVEYTNNLHEESNKSFTETWFSEFPSDQNLLDVQDEKIEEITDQLVENIFTKAFTNW